MKELKAKAIALAGKIVGILEQGIDMIKAQVSSPQSFVLAIILVVAGLDVLFLGSLGFIEFLVAQVTAIGNVVVAILKEGGWPLIIVLLILALRNK
jgi:hypothetical protein